VAASFHTWGGRGRGEEDELQGKKKQKHREHFAA